MAKAFKGIRGSKNNNAIRRFAINKLKQNKVFYINGRKSNICKNIDIEKEYFLTLNSNPVTDYNEYKESKNAPNIANVYLIGNLKHRLVKIGFSNNVNKRLSSIQTGCPFELSIFKTFTGTIQIEKMLHKKYQKYKLRGEWFKIDGELNEVIQNLLLPKL